jgi:hypothetical protein
MTTKPTAAAAKKVPGADVPKRARPYGEKGNEQPIHGVKVVVHEGGVQTHLHRDSSRGYRWIPTLQHELLGGVEECVADIRVLVATPTGW